MFISLDQCELLSIVIDFGLISFNMLQVEQPLSRDSSNMQCCTSQAAHNGVLLF